MVTCTKYGLITATFPSILHERGPLVPSAMQACPYGHMLGILGDSKTKLFHC